MTRRAAAAPLALLVLLTVVTGCTPQSSVGDVVDGRSEPVAGRPLTFLLPSGRLVVRVGDPVGSVPKEETRTLDARDAPDGGVLVPVGWSFEPFGGPQQLTAFAGATRPATVTLVTDDGRYRVGEPYATDGRVIADKWPTSFWVAVPGKYPHLVVAVTYDGLTQTIDVPSGVRKAGAATPWYARRPLPGPRSVSCGPAGWRAGPATTRMTCEISVGASPYDARLGWAQPGHLWTEVTLVTYPGDLRWTGPSGRSAEYAAQSQGDSTLLDGAPPARATSEDASGLATGRLSRTMVFDTTPDAPLRLEIARSVAARLVDAHGAKDFPEPFQATFRRTVDLAR